MANRDYLSINNYSGAGEIGISRGAIAAIAIASLKEVEGASSFAPKTKRSRRAAARSFFSLPSGAKVVFQKNGKALVKMDVTIAKGVNVVSACEKIQEKVATAITLMCDMVPFDVQVKVMRIA